MTTAKKAAEKTRSTSIVDDESEAALVDKIANDIEPSGSSVERQNVKAAPAYASEGPNGAPSRGPNPEIGMTAVVDSTIAEESDEVVRMVHRDGHEIEVNVADVKIHERAGWMRAKEEGA